MFSFLRRKVYKYVKNIIYTMENKVKKSADIRIKGQTPLYDMEKLKAFYGYRSNKKTIERSLRECAVRFISEK